MIESRRPPSYRHYKPKNLAVVRLKGKDHYLGEFDSPQSWERYHRLLAEQFYGTLPPLDRPAATATSIQVKELVLRFFEHAAGYYQRDGKPTSELTCIRIALRRLLKLYGELPAAEFSPQKLKLVREEFVRAGNCRSVINQNISRIRRAFRWAVENELIPVTVYQSLATMAGLRKGRSPARESRPVQSVDDEAVEATLPFLAPQVQAMVRLQRLSGCRPGEIAALRPCDLDQSGDVWCFRPQSHKTEHHGSERRIYFGPRAQEILRPWLDREVEKFCFSPKEAEEMRRATLHARRKTPANHGNRPGTNRTKRPKRMPGQQYNSESYRRAIERACRIAKIEPWSPNQLRHSRATELRRFHGLDAAKVVLGAREQRRIVAQIKKNGGWVRYDFQKNLRGQVAESNLRSALRKYLGEDYFDTIVEVETHSAADIAEFSRLPNIDCLHINIPTLTDTQFLPVTNLRKLRGIDIYGDRSDPNTKISDMSMELLARLPALELVNVESSRITSEGLAKLANSTTLCKLYVTSPDESIEEQAADPLRTQATHLILRRSAPDGFGQIVVQWSGSQPPGPRPFASAP